jgi:glycosyltransferase involved in cell wall biosynthesis
VADAITNCMFFVQSMLRDFGISSEIFAEHVDPLLATRIRPIGELRVEPDDVLLIHHSMGHDLFERLGRLRCRKFLVYHNITPPRFFDEGDPAHAYIVKGYSQLGRFRDVVEATIAVSEYNALQLRQRDYANVTVIPLLKDFAALPLMPHAKAPYYDRSAVFRILFVGRLVPHKCQHELIDFVGGIAAIGKLPVELVLVGLYEPGEPYKRRLDEQIGRLGLHDRVRITGRTSDEELHGWYRAADAYVSLSEHEGFGVPLIEAMALDLPVVAYASSGVAETMADGGVVLRDKSPARLIEPLMRLREDRRFRRDLIRGQRARVRWFSRERIEDELKAWLRQAGIEAGAPVGHSPRESAEPPSAKTHYVIEGPFESSYSLALVNRNMALALNRIEGGAATIEPAEGVEDYIVDADAAERLPAAVRELVRPAPQTANRLVTIRNMYPPRPNGMLGDIRLVHLAWEESAIAPSLADLMNAQLDGVLVPAEYCRRVIRNSGVRLPIAVVGHGVDHLGVTPQPADDGPRPPVSSAAPYTFLHVSGGSPRKGIEELISAYCMAFSRHDPVLLVIKTYENPDNIIDEWIYRVTGRLPLAPAVQIISEDITHLEMELLYRLADAVVLPSRGEGYNLPAAEAMARGRPVITTRHSGQLDFCDDGNSYLLDCSYELSSSHLHVPDSVWARPALGELVEAMRSAYSDGRPARGVTQARVERARRDAAGLRWRDVATRIDRFVGQLEQRPVMTRKLRLAWVSTYNTRCGIAAYSQHLAENFDRDAFDITILADDQDPPRPDPPNVVRLWVNGNDSDTDKLATLANHLLAQHYDIAFFQHNFGFYDFEAFAGALVKLHEHGIDTYVTLHRTIDDRDLNKSLCRIAPALATCTRLFVHTVDDLNRLKEMGLTDNVALVPHGVIERSPLDATAVRLLLGLERFGPVVGSFGFLLRGKDVPALIHGFALMLRHQPNAFLLLINSDYPDPISQRERERCLKLVGQLGLESRVRLVNEFLQIEEINFFLSACDVIVYPYQWSEESDSGAVRLGLAAGRPVATTPIPVFSSMSSVVHQLPGINPAEIAAGIGTLLANEALKSRVLERQREWVRANNWQSQAARIGNIMRGCFEESRNLELRPPAPAVEALSAPEQAGDARPLADGPLRAEHLRIAERFLGRRLDSRPTALVEPTATGASIDDEMPARAEPALSAERKAWVARLRRKPRKTRSQVLADRARDTRQWAMAVRHYRKALEQNSDNSPIWVQYGHALKETGRLGEAEDAYRKSIELAPDLADTHLQLGHVLKMQGRPVEAAAAYVRALALDPALAHPAAELAALGWKPERIRRSLRRERSMIEHLAPDRLAVS